MWDVSPPHIRLDYLLYLYGHPSDTPTIEAKYKNQINNISKIKIARGLIRISYMVKPMYGFSIVSRSAVLFKTTFLKALQKSTKVGITSPQME